jgi:hypothetical protein
VGHMSLLGSEGVVCDEVSTSWDAKEKLDKV